MIQPWSWKQALTFLIIYGAVAGPWIYMAWAAHE